MTTALPDEFDPDLPVVEAIIQRDRFAFEDLSRRHTTWVRAVAMGVVGDESRVDDVVQHVWIRFWDRIGKLRDVPRWRQWLYRLTRNAAVDAGRDKTRRRRIVAELKTSAVESDSSDAPADALIKAERHAIVLDAIRSLPALYREPFVLRHVQGWSYREISDVMGVRVDTVETRLIRARRLLREMLADKV
jgi:RNA polymerase sigma-70 factor, ECF subfamily